MWLGQGRENRCLDGGRRAAVDACETLPARSTGLVPTLFEQLPGVLGGFAGASSASGHLRPGGRGTTLDGRSRVQTVGTTTGFVQIIPGITEQAADLLNSWRIHHVVTRGSTKRSHQPQAGVMVVG